MEAPRVRASDAERESFAERVRKAVGEGRLTMDEGDQRLAAVYATTYRDELQPHVADLPSEEPPKPAASPAEQQWHGHPWAYGRRGMRRWYPPVFPFLWIAVVFTVIWAITGAHGFWPAVPLIFLGIFLVRRIVWWRRWAAWNRSQRS